jgi:urease accessory protein
VRAGIRAATRLTVERAAGRQALRWAHDWPVVLRPTGTGDEHVHLVHAAGGPLGGDDLALSVEVGPQARLTVRSAGATLVQPGAATDAPARWTVELQVAAGGRVHWAPEPTVVSDRAALESVLRVSLAAGAAATVREIVVLGRHGQRGGRYGGALHVAVDGVPLLAHTTLLDGADAALCGPAGTAGARAVGSLVCAGDVPVPPATVGEGDGVRWAWSELDGPGALLLAVGSPAAVTAVLDAASHAVSLLAERVESADGALAAAVG